MYIPTEAPRPEAGLEGLSDPLAGALNSGLSHATRERRDKKNPNSRSGLNPPKEEVEETCVAVKHQQPMSQV